MGMAAEVKSIHHDRPDVSPRISAGDLKHGVVIFPDQFTYEGLSSQFERAGAMEMREWILPDPRTPAELARQGQGIAFLPEWVAAGAMRDGTLVCLKLPGIELRRTWCAWWDPRQPLTWVAEVFLSLLAATIDPAGDDG